MNRLQLPTGHFYSMRFNLSILFDKKLAIKEIKIIKRLGYSNIDAYDYDRLVVDILKSSEKYRRKTTPSVDNDWYFYSGIFPIR